MTHGANPPAEDTQSNGFSRASTEGAVPLRMSCLPYYQYFLAHRALCLLDSQS